VGGFQLEDVYVRIAGETAVVSVLQVAKAAVSPASPGRRNGSGRRDALPSRGGRARTYRGLRRGSRGSGWAAAGEKGRRGAVVAAGQAGGAADRPPGGRGGGGGPHVPAGGGVGSRRLDPGLADQPGVAGGHRGRSHRGADGAGDTGGRAGRRTAAGGASA